MKIVQTVSRRPPPEVLDGWEKDCEVKAQKAQKAVENVWKTRERRVKALNVLKAELKAKIAVDSSWTV